MRIATANGGSDRAFETRKKGLALRGFGEDHSTAIKVLCWSRGAKVKLKPFGRQFVDQELR